MWRKYLKKEGTVSVEEGNQEKGRRGGPLAHIVLLYVGA